MNWASGGIVAAHKIGRRSKGGEKLHADRPNLVIPLFPFVTVISFLIMMRVVVMMTIVVSDYKLVCQGSL